MKDPLRLASLAALLIVAGCATGTGSGPDRVTRLGIAGGAPDGCRLEPGVKAHPSARSPVAPAPSTAQRQHGDIERRQGADRAEERRLREAKTRELECILGAGCVRRRMVAGGGS